MVTLWRVLLKWVPIKLLTQDRLREQNILISLLRREFSGRFSGVFSNLFGSSGKCYELFFLASQQRSLCFWKSSSTKTNGPLRSMAHVFRGESDYIVHFEKLKSEHLCWVQSSLQTHDGDALFEIHYHNGHLRQFRLVILGMCSNTKVLK